MNPRCVMHYDVLLCGYAAWASVPATAHDSCLFSASCGEGCSARDTLAPACTRALYHSHLRYALNVAATEKYSCTTPLEFDKNLIPDLYL